MSDLELEPTPSKKEKWPRLSDDVSPLSDFRICGLCCSDDDVSLWQEHDDCDGGEHTAIALCKDCSDKVIEPHPRLYRRLTRNEPFPGVQAFCLDCKHRKGTICKQSRQHGGPGLMIEYPKPGTMHVDSVRNGKRFGQWLKYYPGPASSCSGREVDERFKD